MKNQKKLSVFDIDEKKRLGAFYTPSALSDILASWAIRSPAELILEPSFGGCGFLKSAADRLQCIGAKNWQKHLYGCDIDARAFNFLSATFGRLVDLSHYELCDFLTFEDKSGWPSAFDAVIGNPPYVPYQSIPPKERKAAIERLSRFRIKLDLRSSLWAYFVALGLTFLGENGRIAWVLPGSLTQANYANGLRRILKSKFQRAHCFLIQERLFLYEGTDEQTVVLLADGYKPKAIIGTQDLPVSVVKNVGELQRKITEWDNGVIQSHSMRRNIALEGLRYKSAYETLLAEDSCKTLGTYLDVRIGLVTGDNKFFVLSPSEAREKGLHGNSLRPILAKFSSVAGVRFKNEDHNADKVADKRCLLIHTDSRPATSDGIERYLSSYPEEKLKTVSTFKKRKSWFQTDDKNIPHAFLPVMCHLGPRLALNAAQINCTNTLYRVYFKKLDNKTEQKMLCISLLSTFSQISAEMEGRKYGSGVLKHEPREAERIRVLMPVIEDWRLIEKEHKKIDGLLREGKTDKAREAADIFILGQIDALNIKEYLDKILKELRAHRHARRSKT